MEKTQNFDFEIKNQKLVDIYNIISNSLDLKDEYSLSEYIDSILINLSFIPGLESLLKYKIFSLIIRYYLSPFNIILNFNENEINISENISLELIIPKDSKKKKKKKKSKWREGYRCQDYWK